MARRLREKSGTGIYHVMLRGINRQDILEDEEDYMRMTSILRGQSERYDEQGLRLPPFCLFYAYCLMSNHLWIMRTVPIFPFLNAWEPSQITNKEEKNRIDATCTNDPVQFLSKPAFGNPDIPLSDDVIRIKSNESINYIHRDLIDGNSQILWDCINKLLNQ